MKRHGKRWGYVKTHLKLTKKADRLLNVTDPVKLYEREIIVEEGDDYFEKQDKKEYRYDMIEPWRIENATEEYLNKCLEEIYEEVFSEEETL